jgi:hypothetical protein
VTSFKQRLFIYGMAALSAAVPFFYSFTLYQAEHFSKNSLLIHFEHVVGKLPLKLDSTTYTNALGQTYTISKFKYYISSISLKSKGGKQVRYPGSFLVNEEESSTKNISLNGVRPDEYTSISFIVGVDSLHNCSGAQSGDLDPVKGMFWAWNTGYVFLKLEGHSPASSAPGHLLEYHVGGYKAPHNSIRRITISLEDTPLITDPGKTSTLDLNVNVEQLLKDPLAIDFSLLPSVTDALHAGTIADNYQDMFSLRAP